MLTGLDEFDWIYHKNDIWFSVTIVLIFWPILLILNPGKLFNSSQLFDFDLVIGSLRFQGVGQKMRSLHQLAVNPPSCSNTLFYCYEGVGDTCNVWFAADDLVLLYSKKKLPLYSGYEAEALVSWVKNRNPKLTEPTEIPDLINFKNVAASLLDAGIGQIECNKCEIRYSASDLSRQKEPIHQGWNFMAYECPNGHTLLKHDYVHFSM